jgi:protein SCO1
MRRIIRYLLSAAVFSLPLVSCQQRVEEDLGPVGAFTLTERSGQTVRDTDLLGKVWIASFVFTRCTGPCPQVTTSIARLQNDLKNEADVRFVTFTVDPEHDHPEELTRYADNFKADAERWLFLTGKEEDIYRLLREGFHVPVEQNRGEARTDGNEVMHSTRLVVVDRRGHVRGYFHGVRDLDSPEAEREYETNMQRVRQTVAALLREAP